MSSELLAPGAATDRHRTTSASYSRSALILGASCLALASGKPLPTSLVSMLALALLLSIYIRSRSSFHQFRIETWVVLAGFLSIVPWLFLPPAENLSLSNVTYSLSTFHDAMTAIAIGYIGLYVVVLRQMGAPRPPRQALSYRPNALTSLLIFGLLAALARLTLLVAFGLGEHGQAAESLPFQGVILLGTSMGLRSTGVILIAIGERRALRGTSGGVALLAVNEGLSALTGSRGAPLIFLLLTVAAFGSRKTDFSLPKVSLRLAVLAVCALLAVGFVMNVRNANETRTTTEFLTQRTGGPQFLAPVIESDASASWGEAVFEHTRVVNERVYGRSQLFNGFATTIWGIGWLSFRRMGVLLVGLGMGVAIRIVRRVSNRLPMGASQAFEIIFGLLLLTALLEGTLLLNVKSMLAALPPFALLVRSKSQQVAPRLGAPRTNLS